MRTTTLQQLLSTAAERSLTDGEFADLLNRLGEADPDSLPDQIIQGMTQVRQPEALNPALARSLLTTIFESERLIGQPVAPVPIHRVHFLRTAWFRYAAVLLLIAGTAIFLYQTNHKPQQEIVQQSTIQPIDIQPGGNRAVLTLADGRTVVLDSAANGNLAQQGNMQVIKLANGQMRYELMSTGGKQPLKEGVVAYNTISTPKGGQYQVVLSDGSKVWLNAASSIRFPAAFVGKERNVTIEGEAYLEVAPDKNRSFFVKTRQSTIQVLGTSFNINAYADEPSFKTSLLEGSIKIENVLLKPGQAFADGKVTAANISQDIAWKNGVFDFQDKKLVNVMRQIGRWYDLDVVYAGNVPAITLVGEMSRNMPLAEMLRTLEQLEVRYTMKGRTITILP